MRDRLVGLLEKADLAIGSCAGVVDSDQLQPLIDLVSRVRLRMSYPEDVLVVALAGGTGSGKSSLFNAIAGEELVDVGGVRPTTSQPAALVPQRSGQRMEGYLDKLGIAGRFSYEGPDLCLIDMPDTDSVAVEHHHRVDALIPFVDVIVWVVDPEKYRDARLHHDYLRNLTGYGPQFVFVLNQADRLTADEAATVVADLRAAIVEDGIEDPTVLALAASPPAGPPSGLDELLRALDDLGSRPSTIYGKLLADLAAAGQDLESMAGTPLDFDENAKAAVEAAATAMVGRDHVAAAVPIVSFLDSIAAVNSGETREKIEIIAAETPAHLERIAGEVEPEPPKKRWYQRTVEVPAPDLAEIVEKVNRAIVRPARAVLAKRAVAMAAVTDLRLEVETLGNATPR